MNTKTIELIQPLKESIEQEIDLLLPKESERPSNLHSAMRYSLLNGGKRARGVLLLLCARSFPSKYNPLPAAVALECIHAYSLIHDDLPAMDDSPLRRNKPSCHIAYDEPTAILAGDGLLTEAFKILSEHYNQAPEVALKLINELAKASGSLGMIAGQQEDIENEGQPIDASTLEYIHERKTARLIQAAINMGFILSDLASEKTAYSHALGLHLGMAFQYKDDLLDAQSDAETLGKPVNSDQAADKLSAVKVYGLEATQLRADACLEKAELSLKNIGGDTTLLGEYVALLSKRDS